MVELQAMVHRKLSKVIRELCSPDLNLRLRNVRRKQLWSTKSNIQQICVDWRFLVMF